MPKHSYYLPDRRLVAQDDAALIQRARVPRSKFTNRFSHLTTFNAGYLIPFMVDHVLPGDFLQYRVTAYVRMSTALFPIFSNQRLDTHFFYVPNRLLWTNFKKFMGEQDNPGDSIAYTVPQLTLTAAALAAGQSGTIYDYMGMPIGNLDAGAVSISVSALPFRAYHQIWNAWFRDQNIQNSIGNEVGDTQVSGFSLQRRAKSHDYFTSALPWPQKFTPLQTLFTGTAPIIGIGTIGSAPNPTAGPFNVIETDKTVNTNYDAYHDVSALAASIFVKYEQSGTPPALDTNTPQIYADLARATGVTINALRQAWLVQDLLERDARGGTRYNELIRSHFGVIVPDARVQRPEYIGGGQTPLNVTPIAQTATGGGGLGALGGVGTAAGQHTASYAATEHGIILGLISVKSELHYQQGIDRHWSKTTRYDFYIPALAGLGEQAILRKEIYCIGLASDDDVFGYQERWHEYRTHYSRVSGMFRSTATGNIDEWHLAQQFVATPTLSDAFIREEPPMTRVLAAGAAADKMQYLADILIDKTAVRPVPMFGTPATLLRF